MRRSLVALTALVAALQAGADVKPVAPLQALPFGPGQVKLLPGPFLRARELDRKYLRSLSPDQLLHTFRLNAGIPSTAKPLGGWEAPECEVRGHFVGHYLSACALFVAADGDPVLRRNAAAVVAGMAECQERIGTGYLSAFPDSFIDRVDNRQPVWAPWYTLHKVLAGLIDMHRHAGSAPALAVATRFADWIDHRYATMPDDRMQAMLGNEHGGISEALIELYAVTGERRYRTLAGRFHHLALLDPAAAGHDTLTGLHANTQIPKFVGAAREYELTADPKLRRAASFFWNSVANERSYVIGGHSDGEMFTPKERLSQALGPNTTETCNTYNMLKLTGRLFGWQPSAALGDFYERALFNHILASQNPETGMMCYYVPLRSGSRKAFNGPLDSFWCCTGTGVENHVRNHEGIYYRSTTDDALYVNLFIASQLSWSGRGVTVTQTTRFPDGAASTLTLRCAKPTAFTLRVRRPAWCPGLTLRLNGKPGGAMVGPDGYAAIRRTWKSGDTVQISLPMSLRTEAFRDNPNRLAFLYGPIVLCGAAQASGIFPAVVAPPAETARRWTPVPGKAMTFRSPPGALRVPGAEAPVTVTLAPFFREYKKPTIVYWDRFTADQWRERAAAYRAQQEQLRALEARTVDVVRPGEEQNERDHKLAGLNHGSGGFGDRKWRHAPDGWFSYEVKVLRGVAQDLSCTYWGSDVGPRTFDILIDGKLLATQTLNRNRPEIFYDETYPLPPEILAGKERVTVRFQAGPGHTAGGLFGLRILRR
ncbi:MAG: glycoside hydrolase family 127 protein [Armatimonadetes bacterium]|nr:glycoside hydrolase family 127 protein [Armatimonadota bacterium]